MLKTHCRDTSAVNKYSDLICDDAQRTGLYISLGNESAWQSQHFLQVPAIERIVVVGFFFSPLPLLYFDINCTEENPPVQLGSLAVGSCLESKFGG